MCWQAIANGNVAIERTIASGIALIAVELRLQSLVLPVSITILVKRPIELVFFLK
jgi:hypothetical protein